MPSQRERDPAATLMFMEAGQAPAAIEAQLQRNAAAVARLGTRLRSRPPRMVVTAARGSSDHAATFAKYLVETRARVMTASAAPSIASVYGSSHELRDCLFLAISQSGRSPDLLDTARAAKGAGALVVALVNDESSPLAAIADETLPLCAGEERSVAATKSYLATLACLVHLVAAWREDRSLDQAVHAAPELLGRAWALDWSAALPLLRDASHLYVIARGLGLGVAQEAALKCKEACGLHAESFSSAEVRHGPQALMKAGFPALLLAQDDETRAGIEELARDLILRDVAVIAAGAAADGATVLPTLESHAAIAPLALVQSFYRLANALAIARGLDPDNPPHLRKVTQTR